MSSIANNTRPIQMQQNTGGKNFSTEMHKSNIYSLCLIIFLQWTIQCAYLLFFPFFRNGKLQNDCQASVKWKATCLRKSQNVSLYDCSFGHSVYFDIFASFTNVLCLNIMHDFVY